jgi:hypothetical protein
MPCNTWEEVAGKKCEMCGGYATHYYGNKLICCDCHGGYLCSQKEAKEEHERIILERDDKNYKKDEKYRNPFSGEIEKF